MLRLYYLCQQTARKKNQNIIPTWPIRSLKDFQRPPSTLAQNTFMIPKETIFFKRSWTSPNIISQGARKRSWQGISTIFCSNYARIKKNSALLNWEQVTVQKPKSCLETFW